MFRRAGAWLRPITEQSHRARHGPRYLDFSDTNVRVLSRTISSAATFGLAATSAANASRDATGFPFTDTTISPGSIPASAVSASARSTRRRCARPRRAAACAPFGFAERMDG